MKNFDLSKFKKVSADVKCTTLKHPDGHLIKIAHGPLSKKMKEDLGKLPFDEKPEKLAAGGYAGRGEESSVVNDPDAFKESLVEDKTGNLPDPSGISYDDIVARNKYSQAERAADQSADSQISSAQRADQADYSKAKMKDYSEQAKSGNYNMAPLTPQAPPSPEAPGTAASATPQPQEQPQQPVAQQAPVAAPAMQSAPMQAPAQAAQTFTQVKSQAAQEHSAEDQAWQQDLNNGHVTPETYSDLFAKKSTLGKIGTIFGLLAGGMGSGLTHQPNALLAMMDKQIQNDFEAQKQSKSNAYNYLNMTNQHELQKAQANNLNTQANAANFELATMKANRAAFHSQVLNVQKMPPGPEKDKAEQALAMMGQAIDLKNAQLGDLAASKQAFAKMMFGNQDGASNEQNFQNRTTGLRVMGGQPGEARAKDMEEKHFPGLKGQASVPLSGEDRTQINSGMEFDQKLHRFMDWTSKHSGDLSPSDKYQGQALAAELQGSYRQATHGGVYKEGEQNFISKLIDSEPTKFFNAIRVMPQLKAIANENQQRVNQLVKSKGFGGYDGPGKQQAMNQSGGNENAQALAWAKANPKDPRSSKILKKLGQ